MGCEWGDKVFNVDHSSFNDLAIEIFHFQYQNNTVYKRYVDALQVNIKTIESFVQIPFLPIRFFKSHSVKTTLFIPEITFRSSGTTKITPALHYIKDLELYEKSLIKTFEMFYGSITNWCIIGLLPSYTDRKFSSLVYMIDQFINLSGQPHSGFYLTEYDRLYNVLKELEDKEQKTFLIGVTFALLDFAENYNMDLSNTTIVETGGMKGRQRAGASGEITRTEVHAILKKAFDITEVHSEYGMTELLSQAYSKQGGIFNCPPWMKVLIRDGDDPLMVQSVQDIMDREHSSGAINVIDLANIYSCSFIATDDVGKLYTDGSFEVLGRMDESDLRGCSLMVV
jgi:phenylacetate-coenzyme A ligase PaaK-like adenylate-forming protein